MTDNTQKPITPHQINMLKWLKEWYAIDEVFDAGSVRLPVVMLEKLSEAGYLDRVPEAGEHAYRMNQACAALLDSW